MFKNFKYLELTRHHMYTKSKRIITNIKKQEESDFLELSEVVFSSALSLFLTYLSKTYFLPDESGSLKIRYIIILFSIAIALYCTLYVSIRKIYSLCSKKIKKFRYEKTIHSPNVSIIRNKELIDDFDHIAFDNLIIAYELLKEIEASTDQEIRTFCFHEVIYYLKTAIKTTKEIIHPNRREYCLNIFGNINGIDVFRLFNVYKLMQNINFKIQKILLDNETSDIIQVYNILLKETLDFQIQDIEADIKYIGEQCTQAQKDIKPKN